jgi:hypothetical protein
VSRWVASLYTCDKYDILIYIYMIYKHAYVCVYIYHTQIDDIHKYMMHVYIYHLHVIHISYIHMHDLHIHI